MSASITLVFTPYGTFFVSVLVAHVDWHLKNRHSGAHHLGLAKDGRWLGKNTPIVFWQKKKRRMLEK